MTGAANLASLPYGLAMRFRVAVDGLDLGHWSACRGLKVDLKVSTLAEGGNYWSEHILPDRISYPHITLERAVHPAESQAVQEWLRLVAGRWMNYDGVGQPYQGQGAVITLLGVTGQEVLHWTLTGVYPVAWSGPTLSAKDSSVALEELELAHEGFLSGGA